MKRAIAPALLAVGLLTGSGAGAQPKRRPAEASRIEPTSPEAREAFDRARALFAKGDYAGSLEALEQTQKLSPDPRLFWNMAACEKKLGHNARAMNDVERYLTAGSATLSETEQRDARQFLAAARVYVAEVTVASGVEGTQVFVDGELAGTTPFAKPVLVDDGEHAVRFVRSGYRTVERKERASGGASLTWAVELELDRASAAVEPVPGGSHPSRLGPILVGGAGIVVAAAGAVLIGITVNEASTLEGECGTTCPPSRLEKYRSLQTVGDVLVIAGGAALLTGIVWFALQPGSRHEERGAWLTPGIGAMSVEGRF